MTRRLSIHGPSPSHREELHQAAWGLVMGCCFAFPAAVVATVVVGLEYGRQEGLLAFVLVTLVGAIATAVWSGRSAGRRS